MSRPENDASLGRKNQGERSDAAIKIIAEDEEAKERETLENGSRLAKVNHTGQGCVIFKVVGLHLSSAAFVETL